MRFHPIIAFLLFPLLSQAQNLTPVQQLDLDLLQGNYKTVLAKTDTCEKNTELMYRRALAYRKNYNYKEALQQTTQLVNLEPENIDFLLEQSRNLIQMSNKTAARDTLFHIFYKLDSTQFNAGILLAKIYNSDDQWSQEADVYRRLLRDDAQNTYLLYHYAAAITNLKNGKDAIPILKEAIRIDPEHTSSRYLLFRIYKALGDYDNAMAQIDTIKQITPADYKPYWESGIFNLGKNYNYRALPEFQRAIELGYPNDDARHNIGKCYYNMQKYEEAIPYLKFSTSQIEDFALLSQLATCFFKLNKEDSALFYLEKSYKLMMPDPSFLNTYYQTKAKIFINNQEYEKAIKCYEKLLVQIENLRWSDFYSMQCIDGMAEIYTKYMNDGEKALSLYKEMLAEASESNNRNMYKYYEHKIDELTESLFFKGEDN